MRDRCEEGRERRRGDLGGEVGASVAVGLRRPGLGGVGVWA